MLQRIQTLYFALSIVLWGAFFSGVSLLSFENTASKTVSYVTVFGSKTCQITNGKESLLKVENQPIFILCGLMIVLVFLTLMRYKSPKKQLGLARFTLLLNALLVFALVVWSTYLFSTGPKGSSNSVGLGYYLLCATLPLSYFGYRGVLSDKMLLDSLDRLR
jgi:amino acid transporter